MPPSPPWISFFWEACGDTAVRILIIAAVIALIGGTLETVLAGHDGAWIDGVAIIIAVLIVTIVGVRNTLLPIDSDSTSFLLLFVVFCPARSWCVVVHVSLVDTFVVNERLPERAAIQKLERKGEFREGAACHS